MSSRPSDLSQTDLRRRVVLLGASNVIRGISTIVETAHLVWGQPADILAAIGHGRSYGLTSSVMTRKLPAIVQCGLWDDLAQRSPLPTAALVTDIGNDILYGASVRQIVNWVEDCLLRLAPSCERLVMTELPLESVARVGEARFLLMRTVLFPRSRVKHQDAMNRAERLNDEIRRLAARFAIALVKPRSQWYGFDPIHIQMRFWPAAWYEILQSWAEATSQDIPETAAAAPALARGSLRRWWRLQTLRPLQRQLFGLTHQQPQPAARLPEGSLVSLY